MWLVTPIFKVERHEVSRSGCGWRKVPTIYGAQHSTAYQPIVNNCLFCVFLSPDSWSRIRRYYGMCSSVGPATPSREGGEVTSGCGGGAEINLEMNCL